MPRRWIRGCRASNCWLAMGSRPLSRCRPTRCGGCRQRRAPGRRAFQVFGDGASRHVRARPAQDRAGQGYPHIRAYAHAVAARASAAQGGHGAGRGARGQVVLAMNAWSTRFRELNKGVVVVGSDLVATAPHPEALEKIGLTSGVAISDSRLFTNYYRNTCAGEMVFGRGGGDFAFNGAVGRLYEGPSRFAREVAAILHSSIRPWPRWASCAAGPGPSIAAWTGCRASAIWADIRISSTDTAIRATAWTDLSGRQIPGVDGAGKR